MGCGSSSPLKASSSYRVIPYKDGEEDEPRKVYDQLWPTLAPEMLLRIAAEAGVGGWRLNAVCTRWRDTLQFAPRKVRFQPQGPEQSAAQVEWVRRCGSRAARWRMEAMGDKGAAGVSEALRANPEIVDVGAYRGRRKEVTLSLRGAAKLAIAITSNRGVRLQRLDLAGNAIKDLGAEKLCRALTAAATTLLGGSTLAWLGLSRNQIGDRGAQAVAEFISAEGASAGNGQALRLLDLHSNEIGGAGIDALAAAAAAATVSGGCCLETCNLSENPLGESPSKLVQLVHAVHPTLRTLRLSHCSLGAEGTAILAAAWVKQEPRRALASLDLSSNACRDAGATAIARMLASGGCPRLTTLSISDNEIGDPGAAEIGAGVRAEACRLRRLDVSLNRIGDDGAIALSLALDAAAGLIELTHDNNRIQAVGTEAISRRIPKPHLLTAADRLSSGDSFKMSDIWAEVPSPVSAGRSSALSDDGASNVG